MKRRRLLAFSVATLAAGTYNLITGASGSGIDSSKFALATTKAFGNTFSLGSSDTALTVTATAGTAGAAQNWNGTTDSSWSTASNWSGSARRLTARR